PVRARRAGVRPGDPLPARPDRRPGPEAALPPAGGRRPEPGHRPFRAGRPEGARRSRGGRGRIARRSPSGARAGAVRRCPGAAARRFFEPDARHRPPRPDPGAHAPESERWSAERQRGARMNDGRKPYIAGNWKMNLDRARALDLIKTIKGRLGDGNDREVAVFTPAVYLADVS